MQLEKVKIAPEPPSNTWFLGSTQLSITNGISISSAVYAQLTAHSPYTLQWLPFPKNCPLPWGIWTPSNTLFLGPTRGHNPNGISIGSAVHDRASLYLTTGRPFTHKLPVPTGDLDLI